MALAGWQILTFNKSCSSFLPLVLYSLESAPFNIYFVFFQNCYARTNTSAYVCLYNLSIFMCARLYMCHVLF